MRSQNFTQGAPVRAAASRANPARIFCFQMIRPVSIAAPIKPKLHRKVKPGHRRGGFSKSHRLCFGTDSFF